MSQINDSHKVLIADFFLQVFKFLIPYTVWCNSRFKRFAARLDKEYYSEHVEGPLSVIISVTKRLDRQGNMQMARNVIDLQHDSSTSLKLLIDIDKRLYRMENKEILPDEQQRS